ncbi:MAG: 2-phosphosulfolactate phosphatase [Planctomycetes bacterium]|nr:2-phosphosulfolactate phosphatase [Planctomycetota bacterium]
MSGYYDQSRFRIRLEWGHDGVRRAAERSDAIAIVDVLSFSTSSVIATSRGATLYPLPMGQDPSELARRYDAEIAVPRTGDGWSLSPARVSTIPSGTRLVLPSPNGSACCTYAAGAPLVLLGALVNAKAAAQRLTRHDGAISVIAAGERWPDNTMRVAVEDLIGAGAIIASLDADRSPEAGAAAGAFEYARPELHATLAACGSGIELIEQGFADDVSLAAQLDAYSCVPLLHDGVIRGS